MTASSGSSHVPGGSQSQAGGAADPAERVLLAALRAGDDAAYETLVRTYGGRLLAVARRYLGNSEEAQDAVQDAFVAAFRAIGSFEGSARLSTWLHQITVNASLMKLRTRRRKPEESIEDLLPTFLDDGHHAIVPAIWSERSDDAYEREETRSYVRQMIDRLPEGYRTVLLLRDIEEKDTLETAEILGLSENAVKTRLHRARQALRTLLSGRFGRNQR